MRLVSPTATLPDRAPGAICSGDVRGMPERIFLARHGISAWNGTRRVTGQADPPLAAEGVKQAQRLARVLEDQPLAAVYSSSLVRAVETARPTAAAQGLEIHCCDGLREQHHGILEGRFRDHRDPEAARLWQERSADRYAYRLPGGESLADVEARVAPALAAILRDNRRGRVLIVGHRNTNRVLLRILLGWSPALVGDLKVRNKLLYEIVPGREPLVSTISLDVSDTGRRYEGLWA